MEETKATIENNEEVVYYEDVLASLASSVLEMTPGTDEYESAANTLNNLYRTKMEYDKIEAEKEEREKQRVIETKIKLDDAAASRKFKAIEIGVTVGLGILNVVLPLAVYSHWQKCGFKFEETGTITSTTFRNNNKLIDKFIKPR